MNIELTKAQEKRISQAIVEKIVDLICEDSEEYGWDIADSIIRKNKKKFECAINLAINDENINKLAKEYITKKLKF